MLPSDFADLKRYPNVMRFVNKQLNMQFDDLRAMMKLPRRSQGLPAGCNFAAALTLCNLIAGIAAILFRSDKGASGKGRGFVALMVKYYPWAPGETKKAKEEIAETLYELVRNPLAHSLGVLQTPRQQKAEVVIKKTPLREKELQRIEKAVVRPKSVLPAVFSEGSRRTVSVVGLYWGFIQMYRTLCRDNRQMEAAERRLAS